MSNPFLYEEKLFVNREREIEQIGKLLEQARAQANRRRKVIAVHGLRGAGKTWFSLHLQRTVFRRPEYRPWLESCLVAVSPEPAPDPGAQGAEFVVGLLPDNPPPDYDTAVRELLKQLIGRYSSQHNVSTYDLHERSRLFVQCLSGHLQTDARFFVLIVDSYMESPPPLQKLLETYLLAPLAALDRCRLILTGRGELPPSMNLSLIPHREDAIVLASFEDDGAQSDSAAALIRTALQVGEQEAAAMAATVKWLGGNYPLAIRQLADFVKKFAEHLNPLPPASPPTPAFRQEFSAIVDTLLSLSGAERQQTRAYFEVLCILDGFKEAELKEILSAHSRTSLSDAAARAVMNTLLRTALVEFREKRYQIHDSIRPVLEKYLYLCEPQTWATLQNAAAAMYGKWAGEHPQHSEYYKARQKRHLDALGETAIAV